MIDVRAAAAAASERLRRLRRRPAHPAILRVALARHSYLNALHARGTTHVDEAELPDTPRNLERATALVGGSVAECRKALATMDRDDQEIVRLAAELEVFGQDRTTAIDALASWLEEIGQ